MRNLRRSILHAALLSAFLLTLWTGCSPLPQYPSSIAWPNKDVLHIRIYVDRSLDASSYREIAHSEAALRQSERSSAQVPVYEIRCEFLSSPTPDDGSRCLAIVRLFPTPDPDDSNAIPIVERTETVVY